MIANVGPSSVRIQHIHPMIAPMGAQRSVTLGAWEENKASNHAVNDIYCIIPGISYKGWIRLSNLEKMGA
jgi:hypothetical protein